MAINTYRSTDSGASSLTLSNTAGQLISILDACLVNGYSIGTVSSITRSGSTATVTISAAHGLLDEQRITIAGATQTEYNGTFDITVASTTTFTYTVTGTPATPATGSPTATKTPAGWTKPYSGTNLAAYLQGTGGNGHYVRIDDTGTTTARWLGYESMTDVNTGTNAFPTNTQVSGGLYFNKSDGATARDWIIVATPTYFYFRVNRTGVITSSPTHFFGKIDSSYYTTDNYDTLIVGGTAATPASNTLVLNQSSFTAASAGKYIARSYTQTGTSLAISQTFTEILSSSATYVGSGGSAYPDPISNGLIYSKGTIIEINTGRRGYYPGLLGPAHIRPLNDLDTFVGTGDFAGQTYLVWTGYLSGQCFVRIK